MKKQTAGREALGDFAPKFAELNDDILFGEVWSREDKLSLRDRSLLTVSTLAGKGILDSSLKFHLEEAKRNGITKDEMAEILTQIGFYAGWPNAWAAFRMAKEVYKDETVSGHGGIFGMGEKNIAYSKYFTGKSYLKPLNKPGECGVFVANVTFEPGCRNAWHIHHAKTGGGQILLCVEGQGWYVEEGKEPRLLNPGDCVTIPANVKHWHGATKDSWFSHIGIEVPGTETNNEWLEAVSDEEYAKLGR